MASFYIVQDEWMSITTKTTYKENTKIYMIYKILKKEKESYHLSMVSSSSSLRLLKVLGACKKQNKIEITFL